MQPSIRLMEQKDKECVLAMMREFYTSPAVFSNGSEEIFEADFYNCIGDCPYASGYVFEDNEAILGYAMIAKSYSTEFGKPCMWIEDLFIKADYRGLGIGGRFLEFIQQAYPDAIFRLEVEEENKPAVSLYKKCGFNILPYMEMKK